MWEKGISQDVDVKVQVHNVPEIRRQRLETYHFPMDHHYLTEVGSLRRKLSTVRK